MLLLRALRLIPAICLSVWFTLIVPAHERGQIRLPGSEGVANFCGPGPAEKTCCPTDSNDEDSAPADDPVRGCAVCHLVAKLSTPDALITPLPDSTPVLERIIAVPAAPPLPPPLHDSRQRAPPFHTLT